jgi:hypothetical protein
LTFKRLLHPIPWLSLVLFKQYCEISFHLMVASFHWRFQMWLIFELVVLVL